MKKYLIAPVFLSAALFLSAGNAFAADLFTVPVSYGMQSSAVLKVQQFLVAHGYLHAAIGGYYGSITAAAVLQFQKDSGITVPNANRVGPMTLAALNLASGGGTGGGATKATSLPAVKTLPAVSVTKTSAVLRGSITATKIENAVKPVFLYGSSIGYGMTAPTIGSDTGASASVTGLTCSTVYHYKISAQNSAGTSTGGDMTFTTLACDR